MESGLKVGEGGRVGPADRKKCKCKMGVEFGSQRPPLSWVHTRKPISVALSEKREGKGHHRAWYSLLLGQGTRFGRTALLDCSCCASIMGGV